MLKTFNDSAMLVNVVVHYYVYESLVFHIIVIIMSSLNIVCNVNVQLSTMHKIYSIVNKFDIKK